MGNKIKKKKLTKEERLEIRLENRNWRRFIAAAKKKGALVEESIIENGVKKIIYQK